MILRFLKGNQAYHFVLIPLVVGGLWFRSYLFSESYPFFSGESSMPLYALLTRLLGGSLLAGNILSIALVVLLSFLILHLNTAYTFIQERTFLPSNIFVLIVSGLLSLHTLHPVYFGALFLLLVIDHIFNAYESRKILSNAFDAGFFLGLGSLFYLNLIFYFPVIWIGFLLIRKSLEWRNFLLSFIGAALPWLFAFSWYFFHDFPDQLWDVVRQNLVTPNNFLRGNIHLQIYLAFLTAFTLGCSLFLLGRYDAQKISTRKYFQIFFLVFLISFVLLLLVPAVSREILVIMAIPLTFLISNYLMFIRKQFWGNVILFIFFGMILYLQFVN